MPTPCPLLPLAALAAVLPARPPAHTVQVADLNANPTVRVALTRCCGAWSLKIGARPGARLLDAVGQERASGAGPWRIQATARGAACFDGAGKLLGVAAPGAEWRLEPEDMAAELAICRPFGAPRRYRGALDIAEQGGRLRAVNEIAVETYLRGVVASEMGRRAPAEALKAQAVASRTYAMYSIGRWAAQGYDLRDTVDSQVYLGVAGEMPESDSAVAATQGAILTEAGAPIPAYFCADCGGTTEAVSEGQATIASATDTDAAPHHTSWSLRITPERLAALLARCPRARAAGTLAGIEVADRDSSGRVTSLKLTWQPSARSIGVGAAGLRARQPHVSEPDSAQAIAVRGIYAARGLYGGRRAALHRPRLQDAPTAQAPALQTGAITGNMLRELLGIDTLRSTLFSVRRGADGAFVIDGRGWGHGKGMCQVGAIALAATAGYDYRRILERYYAGATLTRLHYLDPEQDDSTPAQPPAAP